MKFKETAAVDVSKLTIDVRIHLKGKHKQFENNTKGRQALQFYPPKLKRRWAGLFAWAVILLFN